MCKMGCKYTDLVVAEFEWENMQSLNALCQSIEKVIHSLVHVDFCWVDCVKSLK